MQKKLEDAWHNSNHLCRAGDQKPWSFLVCEDRVDTGSTTVRNNTPAVNRAVYGFQTCAPRNLIDRADVAAHEEKAPAAVLWVPISRAVTGVFGPPPM